MVTIQCEEELDKVSKYLQIIFQEFSIDNTVEETDDMIIKIGYSESLEIFDKPKEISIPHNPTYWLESKAREAKLANLLKTAAALRILNDVEVNKL